MQFLAFDFEKSSCRLENRGNVSFPIGLDAWPIFEFVVVVLARMTARGDYVRIFLEPDLDSTTWESA